MRQSLVGLTIAWLIILLTMSLSATEQKAFEVRELIDCDCLSAIDICVRGMAIDPGTRITLLGDSLYVVKAGNFTLASDCETDMSATEIDGHKYSTDHSDMRCVIGAKVTDYQRIELEHVTDDSLIKSILKTIGKQKYPIPEESPNRVVDYSQDLSKVIYKYPHPSETIYIVGSRYIPLIVHNDKVIKLFKREHLDEVSELKKGAFRVNDRYFLNFHGYVPNTSFHWEEFFELNLAE